MTETILLMDAQRKQRNKHHRNTLVAIHGACKPFSQNEYNKIGTRQKSVFRKGKTFAFNNLWNHNNLKPNE